MKLAILFLLVCSNAVGADQIFVIAGQSNAMGYATNNQSYSGAAQVRLFNNAYQLATISDPTDSNAGQVDSVSTDSDAGGSAWLKAAEVISTATNLSQLWVPCAKSGSAISSWIPLADHQDRTSLYGSMVFRSIKAATNGTLKAVLWWQGESDAISGMSSQTYQSNLHVIASAVWVDLGIPLITCKLQNSTNISDSNENQIRIAVGNFWATNGFAGPDFSDLDSDDNYHLRSNTKIAEAGTRWGNVIVSLFYPTVTNGTTAIADTLIIGP